MVCAKDYDQHQLVAWAKLGTYEKRWKQRIEAQYFIVAKVQGNLAGFASIDEQNYLDVFYVSKDFQQQGIASRLFAPILAKAGENQKPEIVADVSKTARAFFERKGFQLIKENKNMLDGMEIINYRMEKSLL